MQTNQVQIYVNNGTFPYINDGSGKSECIIIDGSGTRRRTALLDNSKTYRIMCPGGTIIELNYVPHSLCNWKMLLPRVGSEFVSIVEEILTDNPVTMRAIANLEMMRRSIDDIKIEVWPEDEEDVEDDDVMDEDSLGVDFLLSAILTKSLAFIGDHPNAEVTVKLTNCGSHPDCTMRLSASRLRAVEVLEDPEAA